MFYMQRTVERELQVIINILSMETLPLLAVQLFRCIFQVLAEGCSLSIILHIFSSPCRWNDSSNGTIWDI